MAIYHFNAKTISRGKGQSAVASAAYRSAERLVDERQGVTHDYTKKQDVLYSEILLPKGAPEWMKEREKLWNAVETSEKRKDSQLARELNISLPRELTLEKNKELIKEYVQENFVNHGMVADICIHEGHATDGKNQPHAHIMLSLRKVNQDGFGQKAREWNNKANLLKWREEWANSVNLSLAKEGLDLRIDHRSFEEQGIDLAPQSKIGATVARDQMARLEEHQQIAYENGQWILENPEIALDALVKQQSTFTHHDLARFINRHTRDAEQFETVYAAVKNHTSVVKLGLDEQGRERFSTTEQLALERDMLLDAKALAQLTMHPVDPSVCAGIAKQRQLTPEQSMAFEHLIKPDALHCMVGYAGTGKSYLLGGCREAWEEAGYHVKGMTLSGIAAQNLKDSSGIDSRTIASYLYAWDNGYEKLSANDVVVVDEAGMIGSRQMARILAEVKEVGAKVALIGDPEQLQAIEAGAAFRAIAEQTGYVELTEIRRQKSDWQQKATYEFATRQTEKALSRYQQEGCVHEFETASMARAAIIEKWQSHRSLHPDESQIILAGMRKDVRGFNEDIRTYLKSQDELGASFTLQREQGALEICVNDKVYFLKNDRNLGVRNGTLGTLKKIEGDKLHIELEGGGTNPSTVVVDPKQYADLAHGYAATIHKGQGVTTDRSYLFASKMMDSHLAYVGMTRHRDQAELFYSKEDFPSFKSLANAVSRGRHKDMTIDYLAKPMSSSPEHHKTKSARQSGRGDPFAKEKEQLQKLLNPKDSLKEFQQQFEKNHPMAAQDIKDSLLPAHVLAAKKVMMNFQALGKQAWQDKSMYKQLEKMVVYLQKNPKVMSEIKGMDEKVFHQLSTSMKQFQKDLSLDRDRGRSL